MKKKWLFRTFTFSSLLLLLLTTSCQRDDAPEPVSFTPEAEQDGMIRLGKKLENPYTVDNMRKAYANLVSRGILKSGITIDATHLYIRFLPANDQEMEDFENALMNYIKEDQLEELESEFIVTLFDYPLEYEILEGGNYYYDPSLPQGKITWQYTAVPVNFPIPAVQHERIAELFLNGTEIEEAMSAGGSGTGDFWDLLETEALILAGDPDAEIFVKPGLKNSRWRPSGRITVWDDILGRQIPLLGAKVRARRWFTTYSDLTDQDGKFSVNGTFTRKVNYSIIWERADWDIVDMRGEVFWWWQAYYNIPKDEGGGPWFLAIGGPGDTNRSLRYATMHRALHRYFYEDRLGLKQPFNPAWYQSRLKVGYSHNDGASNAIPYLTAYGRSHCEVYGRRKGSSTWRTTNDIFAVTIHEVAHVSHYDMITKRIFSLMWLNQIVPGNSTKILTESWANAVEWGLTNLEYNTLGQRYGHTEAQIYNHGQYTNAGGGMQKWNKSWIPSDENARHYTPLYIDMVDNFNQRQVYGNGTNTDYPNDNVTGYTFGVIERNILTFGFTIELLKVSLKQHKPQGVNDAQIDELINFYSNL